MRKVYECARVTGRDSAIKKWRTASWDGVDSDDTSAQALAGIDKPGTPWPQVLNDAGMTRLALPVQHFLLITFRYRAPYIAR